MRMITNIAKTIPVTSPAVHHKLFHMAATTLTVSDHVIPQV